MVAVALPPLRAEGRVEVSCYLSKQRHILLEEGNVEQHSEVVKEGKLEGETKG